MTYRGEYWKLARVSLWIKRTLVRRGRREMLTNRSNDWRGEAREGYHMGEVRKILQGWSNP
jgi:hypothetical protein